MASLANSQISAFNNIGTSPITIIAANPSRSQITFHNPGTVDIFVGPTQVFSAPASSVPLVPSLGSLGGMFRIFANGGDRVITGAAATQAFQCLAASGVSNPLTVMEQ